MSPARPCTSTTVPSHGASKSNTDLSLSISAIFWPFAILAPGTTRRSMTVNSFTVAPIEGTGTSIRKVSMQFGGFTGNKCYAGETARSTPGHGNPTEFQAGASTSHGPPDGQTPLEQPGKPGEGNHVGAVGNGLLGPGMRFNE